jgi:short-subunit dehydrogenase
LILEAPSDPTMPSTSVRFRTVFITGGTAGVGRALARRFARAGARLGVIAREPEALAELKAELAEMGAECAVAAADVADAGALFSATDHLVLQLGPPDLWINNAMATVFSPLIEITPEEFRRVTEETYLGFVHGTMAALRQMQPRGRGKILQVGSALAYRGIPLQSAYCGAKHAIRGFTDSLRAELIHDRSRIALCMVQLPAVNTPQFDWALTHRAWAPRPVAPVMQPEAVANAIYRAAHGRRREYWIGRSTVMVILGNMVLPGFLDRYLARNAYEGQDRDIPVAPDRQANLFAPVAGLHRCRGAFSNEARNAVGLISGAGARGIVLAAALICLGGAAALAVL